MDDELLIKRIRHTAVSPEVFSLRKAAIKLVESTERSMALFGDKTAVLSRLEGLAAECIQSDWDQPMQRSTLSQLLRRDASCA